MTVLRPYLARELPFINGFIQQEIDKLSPVVQPVARHAFQSGGKRLRPLLTLLAARALGEPPELDLYPLACSLEFIHTATLLHDDILDQAQYRRGLPAAHTVHGLVETILAGDALLGLANKLVADYGDPRLTRLVAEGVMRTAEGEILEIAQAKRTTFDLQSYLEVITGKTAFLLQAACQCGAVAAGAAAAQEAALADFGLNLGVAFQLVDDALDYSSELAESGKPRGGDLREGKLTLPLILYLESLPEPVRDDLGRRVREGSLPEEVADETVAAVTDGGFADRTRTMAGSYVERAEAALAGLPDGEELVALREMCGYVLVRAR